MRIDGILALLLASILPAGSPPQPGPVEGVVRSSDAPANNAVVYLEPMEGAGERARTPESMPPVIDQHDLEFLPAVVVVQPGGAVDFLNSDGILHNVFSPGWAGEEFDLGTYPSGATRSHVFTEPGPHVILCKVHPEMVAYVVVVETPYFAVSDSTGRFQIGGVPPGRYELTAWRRGHEPWHADLVVPANGVRALTIDLASPGLATSSGAR